MLLHISILIINHSPAPKPFKQLWVNMKVQPIPSPSVSEAIYAKTRGWRSLGSCPGAHILLPQALHSRNNICRSSHAPTCTGVHPHSTLWGQDPLSLCQKCAQGHTAGTGSSRNSQAGTGRTASMWTTESVLPSSAFTYLWLHQ